MYYDDDDDEERGAKMRDEIDIRLIRAFRRSRNGVRLFGPTAISICMDGSQSEES